jgi:hypothetical protein
MPIDTNALEAYRRAIARAGQPVAFQRVTGQAPSAVTANYQVNAIFRAYQPTTAVGGAVVRSAEITEGQREFIVLSGDLSDAGFPLPLAKNDKIIVGSEKFNITEVDPGTRIIAGAIQGKAVGV